MFNIKRNFCSRCYSRCVLKKDNYFCIQLWPLHFLGVYNVFIFNWVEQTIKFKGEVWWNSLFDWLDIRIWKAQLLKIVIHIYTSLNQCTFNFFRWILIGVLFSFFFFRCFPQNIPALLQKGTTLSPVCKWFYFIN